MTTTQERATAAELDPGPLIKLTIADCTAKVLQSAVSLGVFDAVEAGPADPAAVCAATKLHPTMAPDFLDALVGIGLLERTGGRYRNAPLADAYLVRGRTGYLGGFIELTNETLYDTWGRLSEALVTGEPQHLDTDKGGFVGNAHANPEKMKRFLGGLDAFSNRMALELANRIDWSVYNSFVDIGGARGNLTSAVARAHPHLTATCFDLPRTQPLFQEHVAELGPAERISFVAGDFFTDPLPRADVVVLGHILHGFGTEQRQLLLRRVFDAVHPGGVVLIYDRMIDDDRRDPDRLLSSLHMRLVSRSGSEYRVDDCRTWVEEVGFTVTSASPLLGTHTLMVGQR